MIELDFLKINEISLKRLSNAEFIYFITRFIELLEAVQAGDDAGGDDGGGESLPEVQSYTDGVTELYITQEMIDSLKESLAKLQEQNRETRSRVATKDLAEIDKRRDNLAAFILDAVNRTVNMLSDATEIAAVRELQNALKVYTGIGKLPQNQETVTIRGMLSDIRKEQFSAAVEAAGIEKHVNLLEEENERFAKLSAERSLDISKSRQVESSKDVRAYAVKLYNLMAAHAAAANLLHGTETTKNFIYDLNSHIEETKMYYNLRGTTDKDEDEGDTPEDDDKPVVS